METAKELKEKGNLRFVAKEFEAALDLYTRALSSTESSLRELEKKKKGKEKEKEEEKEEENGEDKEEEEKKELRNLKITLLSNQAACLLSLKRFDNCIQACNKAIELNKNHEKAVYRRSKAYLSKGRPDLAYLDMRDLVRIKPADKKLKKELEAIRRVVELERGPNFVAGQMKFMTNGTIGEKLQALQTLLSGTQTESDAKNGKDLLSNPENISVIRSVLQEEEKALKQEEKGQREEEEKRVRSFVVVHNKRAIEFEMPGCTTVRQLKEELYSKTKVEPAGQLLVGSEVLYHPNEAICRYGVREGSQISLVLMREERQRDGWEGGKGEDAWFRKHGSCLNLKAMILQLLFQVSKHTDNCKMILDIFGSDFFLNLLDEVLQASVSKPRGVRRNLYEFARVIFLLCEVFVALDQKKYLSPVLDAVVKVLKNEDISSSVTQSALRVLGRIPWKEEMTPLFVDKYLNPILGAGSRRPLNPPPVLWSGEEKKEKEKEKEKEEEEDGISEKKKGPDEELTDKSHLYCGYVNLSCQRMSSVALTAIFMSIRERKQSIQYKTMLTNACHSYIAPLLRGDDIERNIRGLIAIITVSMAHGEVGKDIVVKENTAITAGLTSFPASSRRAKHTMLLLVSEIVATASSSKEFRIGHVQYGEMEEVCILMSDSARPDVQARSLAILAKLAKDNVTAQELLKREGETALNVAAEILTEYNKTGTLSGSGVEGNIFHSGNDDPVDKDKVFGELNSAHWTMEAVSYFTGIPEFKEKIVHHPSLLGQMILFIAGYDVEEKLLNLAQFGSSNLPDEKDEKQKGKGAGGGTVSDFGFVGAIFNLTYDPTLALSADERHKAEQIEMLHQKAGTKEKRVHELDETPIVTARLHRLLDLNIGRALAQIGKAVLQMSESLQEMLAGCFLHLTRIEKKRGQLAADGAIRVLTSLGTNGSMRCRTQGAQALARILISTNPHIALKNGAEYNAIPALFHLLSATDDGLGQFEALMALTNLASMGSDVANAIVSGKRLSIIESLHHENHPQLRRAATELLCNLTASENYAKALTGEGGATRFLILTKLVFEDELPTADAAMAIIALTCGDPDVQKHILNKGDLDCFAYGLEASRPGSLQHRTTVAVESLSESKVFAEKFIEYPSLVLDLERIQRRGNPAMVTSATAALQNFRKHGVLLS